jgi:formate/nitrite transporter
VDHVSPAELVSDALAAAEEKARLSIRDLLIRGALAGAFLGYATSLVFVSLSQGLPAIVGALVFPVGFVMLVLLGLELATGNFALFPAAMLDGRISPGALLRNWTWVFAGNLAGSLLYAFLFYLAITNCGAAGGGPVAEQVRQIAQKKTLAYAALGGAGWGAAFVKAVLCNWMVTTGTMLSFASRSTAGKIVAMWLPIATFFAHGYEHSVVNMFVIPAGMLLAAHVSTWQWWLWNQIPVTLGNIAAGALFTGAALWLTHGRRRERHLRPASEHNEAVA